MSFISSCIKFFAKPQLEEPTFSQAQAPLTSLPFDVLDVIKEYGLQIRDIGALSQSCKELNRWHLQNFQQDSPLLSRYLMYSSQKYPPHILEKELSRLPAVTKKTPYDFELSSGGVCTPASLAIIAKKFPNMRSVSYTLEKSGREVGIGISDWMLIVSPSLLYFVPNDGPLIYAKIILSGVLTAYQIYGIFFTSNPFTDPILKR